MKSTLPLLSIVIFIFAVSLCAAQDTVSAAPAPVKARCWTLEFGIAPNFTLTSFQGTAVSLSRSISDFQKIRIGVSTSLAATSNDADEIYYAADTVVNKTMQADENGNNSIRLTVQYLTYASPHSAVSLYAALGPLAGITWGSRESNRNYFYVGGNLNVSNNSDTQKEYFAGMLGSLGAEWFFSEKISLHAEYGVTGTYSWYKDNYTTSDRSTYTPSSTTNSSRREYSVSFSGWSLQAQNILFGLSVML